ncbi:MAG: c-type cytochrome [Deltaproteobacteria bacterium]|nr:MAG: c-type cytochrome [Deltaproteobacteria bacterium]
MKRALFVSSLIALSACQTSAPQPTNWSATPKYKIADLKTPVATLPSFKMSIEAPFVKVPLGLDPENLNIPTNNPLTPEKVELGKMLYFDTRLSADGSVSCATCHNPEKGWTDQLPVSSGIRAQKGGRSAPTVINSTLMVEQFWDGRAATLEDQALGPLVNPIEMGNPNHETVTQRVQAIPSYVPYFQKAFHEGVTKQNIGKAIASFERTVLSGNSRYDRYTAGETSAMNTSEVNGMNLFFGKANCTRCHAGPNFSDSMYHNLGIGMDKPTPDQGRFVVSKQEQDIGAFKTPTIRDITKTAPYMHDGSEATLEAVVELYDRGGNKNTHLDPRMEPLNLSPQEKSDLVNFMKALDGNPYPKITPPKLPE